MSHRLHWIVYSLLLASSFALGTIQQNWSALRSPRQSDVTVPTIFIHGLPSNYHAEVKMVHALIDAGVTTRVNVIRANVTPTGHVYFTGHLPIHPHHPLVEVELQNSHEKDDHVTAAWLKNVVVALQAQYHFKTINLVGHSSGPLIILYYLMDNLNDHTLPQTAKVVSLGGAFNGSLGPHNQSKMHLRSDGFPLPRQTAEYRGLLPLHDHFPRYIRVLNIYGDLQDGSHSDGRVANISSRAMRYLVQKRARSYQEVRVTGFHANHSGLHNNKKVDFYLVRFLYGENC